MYYEQKLINDVLMFRTTPDGQWRQVSITALSKRVVEQTKRIAELERILQATHIHSRKHTPGYCTVRQSDIDAIGEVFDPPTRINERIAGDE